MEEFTRTLRDAAAVHIDKETLFQAVPMSKVRKMCLDRWVKLFGHGVGRVRKDGGLQRWRVKAQLPEGPSLSWPSVKKK
jgi:hypothetical protein